MDDHPETQNPSFSLHTSDGQTYKVQSSMSLRDLPGDGDKTQPSSTQGARTYSEFSREEAAEILRVVRIRVREAEAAMDALDDPARAHQVHTETPQGMPAPTQNTDHHQELCQDQSEPDSPLDQGMAMRASGSCAPSSARLPDEASHQDASTHESHIETPQHAPAPTNNQSDDQQSLPDYDEPGFPEHESMSMDGATASPLGTARSEDRPNLTTPDAHTPSVPSNLHGMVDSSSSSSSSKSDDDSGDDLCPSQHQDQVQVDHHAIFKHAEQALLTHGTPAMFLQLPNGDFLCQAFRPQACRSQHEGELYAHTQFHAHKPAHILFL